MSKPTTLTDKLAKARVPSHPHVADRAKRGLMAFVTSTGASAEVVQQLADGSAAQGIGRIGLSALTPGGLACQRGCAFCCILSGEDGGTITEAEAVALYDALAPLAGAADGRDWHPDACPSLDPDTRTCRAYDARPMICRAYVSTDVEACKRVAEGEPADGPGTLEPYHTYLAAIGLSRAALKGTKRVATYALSRLAAAAVEGETRDAALNKARHAPSELDAELRRSKRDLSRAT
ncbi:YkgJ family cysteine cluster protein [Marivita hallyeonensis]|uniref:Putative zinc-or iron-chelating domain-containing protein n=1 Tax=Marivita hallyeonensis TaxID=996342 RepID=A0A1M5TYA6_9RHOB|nr:YkgJ family cysteine cluster protein [Marivita hallyeonensis]SHH55373.1 Putative zinc-or iron-chelating domain-containing protein [Marivita hallyeonensis]